MTQPCDYGKGMTIFMVRPVDYNATTTIYDNLNVKKTAEGQYYPAQLEQTR